MREWFLNVPVVSVEGVVFRDRGGCTCITGAIHEDRRVHKDPY
jgi:hypothetical protein